ncbi:uncharacterized protein UDID_19408 [Ustilago sp. UG-2017a]|nr:uncharacterized protein UDID_19408 [Ustilago sp. UG-2017a]
MTTSTDNSLDISAQLFWQSTTPTSSATQTKSMPVLSQSGSTSAPDIHTVMGLNAQEAGGSLVHMKEHSAVSMETMDSYKFTCKGGAGPYVRRARHEEDQAQGAGTATKRTKLKEHADGYHSGARETRAKGTITGQREGAVYRRPASRS